MKDTAKDIESLLSSNQDKARRLTHTIKGLSGNMGATALSTSARILEEEGTSQHLQQLKTSLTEVITDLQNHLQPQEEIVSAEKQEISHQELSKLMQELTEAITKERPQLCTAPLKILSQFQLPAAYAEPLAEIKISIENFDFDEALQKIKRIDLKQ